MDMIVNDLTPEEVALNKELPLVAVREAVESCASDQELLKREAEEERLSDRALVRLVSLVPGAKLKSFTVI